MNASQSIFVAPLLGLLWATSALGACGGSDGATINADGADASTGTGQPSPDGAVASSGDGAATATDATTPSPPPIACAGGGSCVPPAPGGWTGPVVVAEASGAAPACPTAMPQKAFEHHKNIVAQAAPCTCSCDLKGEKCVGNASFSSYGSVDCSVNSCGGSEPITVGECSPFITVNCGAGPDKTVGWKTSTNLTAQGRCDAALDPTPPPAATWEKTVVGCGSLSLSQGTCAAGNVCAPGGDAPFGTRHCIFATGDQACPAGPYTTKSLVYDAFDDTRSCGACSCTGPTGLSCASSIAFYSGAGCTSLKGSSTLPGCVAKPITSGYFRVSANAVGGTCTPSAPAPTGAATPKSPTTVCCIP